MHVLLIPSFYSTPQNPVAGAFFRDQAHALHDYGVRVGVLSCPQKAPWQKPLRPGAWPEGIVWEDDQGVATVRGYWRRYWPGYNRLRLSAWVRFGLGVFEQYSRVEKRPDLIHVHAADPAALLAAEIKSRHGVPFVLTEHTSRLALGTGRPVRQRIAAAGIREASAAIAVSPALAEMLALRLPLPSGGWRVVPNCVSRQFLEVPIPDVGAAADSTFRVLTVGNFVPVKGQEVLLRAFAAAFGGDSRCELRLGGRGPREKYLRRLGGQLGIGGQARFLGPLSREQVLAEMTACDMFVLPSLFETFGVVLIEALAVGRPVIATRCGGPESIVHERNGVLVAAGEVGGLAAALTDMRTSAGTYDPEHLRNDVMARFGPHKVAQQLAAVYEKVLSR
ncbi:MAG: glycosyltransferase [Gemmatimonadota bacterium]|nr:MAG: glycosyltransferase [Gemmatimonadota bacterium]